jgi:glycosyltransferase involved in cell wall biosynthesis
VPQVIFDSQVFAEQQHGGVSRYFLELARALASSSEWTPVLAVGLHLTNQIPPFSKHGLHLRIPEISHTFRVRRELNRWGMKIRPPRADGMTVYHPTWYHLPTVRTWGHLPLTVTVHDLIPERWSAVTDQQQLSDRRAVFRMARSLICVSSSTMVELEELYPELAPKAQVVRLGLPALPIGRPEGDKGHPYLVHVGKRGAYKDFATVLRAMPLLPEISLAVVGGGPPGPVESELISRLGIGDRLRYLPGASDQRLADLMAGSVALVSASRAEGFGLPALEALAQGCHPVLSDIPVYRELFGDWATFFTPGDPTALAAALAGVAAGPPPPLPPRPELESRFSWEETAKSTASAYQIALG